MLCTPVVLRVTTGYEEYQMVLWCWDVLITCVVEGEMVVGGNKETITWRIAILRHYKQSFKLLRMQGVGMCLSLDIVSVPYRFIKGWIS